MYAVEKKYDIEMKLKKEMSNIQELKAAANRSSALAGDVCNVLGACEQRLQQLETAVLPLYGDTARLQQIFQNMESTVKSLDNVINFYMLSRELADFIQAGPHTATPDSLKEYLEALDKLAEAQSYFNKNNPQSVELENINQLYNTGVQKLESAFEDLLSRNTRPLSPSAIMDMIALEEDSSVDSVSVSVSGGGGGVSLSAQESLRAAAGWLSAAGRAPAPALLAARAPALRSAYIAFRDYLRTSSMGPSPLMRTKNVLNRSDSTKKTSKIQKVLEKRANKIIMKASQTLEQSTGLAIGPRRGANESLAEEDGWECEAEALGSLGAALARLAHHETRQLLGLVPVAQLAPLVASILQPATALLHADVNRACQRWLRQAARCGARAAEGWALVARLQALGTARTHLAPLVDTCRTQCLRCLEEWVEGLRNDTSSGPVDGTVHQLAAAALLHLHTLADLSHTLGPALGAEPAYVRAAGQVAGGPDRDALMVAIYMRKVLAQLNLALRSKSEQYPEALMAIFLLNNTFYLMQGLQRSGLMEILALAEPQCDASYRDLIHEYKTNYLNSWNKLLAHTMLEEPLPSRLRDKDRQLLKDKFSSFNRELEESARAQRGYSVPEPELRETLKRDNKETLLPSYTRFYDACAALPFSKNPAKYVKYTPVQVAALLDSFFDEAA